MLASCYFIKGLLGKSIMRRSLSVLLILLASPQSFAQQPSVTTEAALYQDVPHEQFFDGVVEAVHQATVSSQTAGRIQSIAFDVNDTVTKGEEILRLRDTDQRSELEAAAAGLNEAVARRKEAQDEQQRIKDIYAQRLVAKAAMDKADAELKSAEARVRAAKARVAKAQENLERTVVRAPYNGIVVKRLVEVGENAVVGTPLMQGLSLEQLRVTVSLPQAMVGVVRAGAEAHVLLPATSTQPDRRVLGSKVTVFPMADASSHSFSARIELPPADYGVYPGMFVKVGFSEGTTKRLMVPESALVWRSEVTGVYVVDDQGDVSLRQVRVGRHHEGRIEVLAGLSEGERFALDPITAGVLLKQQTGKQ